MGPNSERTIGELLADERRRLFVGRQAELATLETLLDTRSARRLIAVTGPAGTGKTELLSEFSRRAVAAGACVAWIDAGDLPSSESECADAVHAAIAAAGLTAVGPEAGKHVAPVLVIDRFELVTALDPWLRERLLPSLSSRIRIVVASRRPLAAGWTTHPAWRSLLHVLALSTLPAATASEYLTRRGTPAARRSEIVRIAGGHALALALIADLIERAPESPLRMDAVPDIVATLLAAFVEVEPDGLRREALWVLALTRRTSEELLGAVVGPNEAGALYRWLRGLSFVATTPFGLVPHELVRELLAADLKARFPYERVRLMRRAATHYRKLLGEFRQFGADLFFDISYLWQSEVPIAALSLEGLYVSTPRPSDTLEIEALVRACHGPEATMLLRYWMEASGAELVIVRGPDDRLQGFALYVVLDGVAPESIARDPAVAAVRRVVGPDVRGMVLQRWIVDRALGEAPSETMMVLSQWEVQRFIVSGTVSDGFSPWRNLEHGLSSMPPGMLAAVPEADFVMDGHCYHMIASTARGRDLLTWFVDGMFGAFGEQVPAPAVAGDGRSATTLDRRAFDAAVRAALKDFLQPERLVENPLLASSLVAADVRGRASLVAVEGLRAVVREGVASLESDELDRVLLSRSFLAPRVKQARIAFELGMPFGTYRRRVRGAVARITEWLWLRMLSAD